MCNDKPLVWKSYGLWIIRNVTYKIPSLDFNHLNNRKTWSCRLQACNQWDKTFGQNKRRQSQTSQRFFFPKVTFQSLEYIQKEIIQNPKTWSCRLQAYIQQNNLLVELEERKPRPHKQNFFPRIHFNHWNTDKRMSYKTLKIEVVDCKLALNRTKIYSRIRGEKTRPHEQNFFPRLHFNRWHTCTNFSNY